MYLCAPCSKRIHSGMKTSKHKVADLDKMKPEETTARITVRFAIFLDYIQNCAAHPKEESVLYCVTCESLACVLCAYGAHKQHNISLLADASDAIKQQLRTKGEQVLQAGDSISRAIRNLQAEIFQLKEVSLHL
jgi:hypothetical protein